MLVAIEGAGGATASNLSRARAGLAVAAEMLAAVCRDRRTSPDAVAAAEAGVAEAFAHYGKLMLAAAAAGRRPRP